MGLLTGFGYRTFVSDQNVLASRLAEMLLEELTEDFRPSYDGFE